MFYFIWLMNAVEYPNVLVKNITVSILMPSKCFLEI